MKPAHDPINQLGDVLNEYARGPRAVAMILAELGFCLVMPLLRRNMGERYFSMFFISVMSVFAYVTCMWLEVNPTATAIYLGILFTASIYHLIVIYRRNARDELWHTRFEGDFNIQPIVNLLPKGKNYWVAEGFYEPLLIISIGLLFQAYVDMSLGSIFIFSGFWMICRSRYLHMIYRQKILDERDSLIESQFQLAAINGNPPEETAGLVLKNAKEMKKSDKKAYASNRLDKTDFAKLVQ